MNYFLIQRDEITKESKILLSVKNKKDILKMVLKYMEIYKIKNLVKSEDFNLPHLQEGEYVVEQSDMEYSVYSVVNTGILFDFYDFTVLNTIKIQGFEVTDDVDDTDDVTTVLNELQVRSAPIDIIKK